MLISCATPCRNLTGQYLLSRPAAITLATAKWMVLSDLMSSRPTLRLDCNAHPQLLKDARCLAYRDSQADTAIAREHHSAKGRKGVCCIVADHAECLKAGSFTRRSHWQDACGNPEESMKGC